MSLNECSAREVLCVEINVLLDGNDIADFGVDKFTSWKECSSYCRSLPTCTWWTYSTKGSRRCHVKTSDSGRRNGTDVISGSRLCGSRLYYFWKILNVVLLNLVFRDDLKDIRAPPKKNSQIIP